MLLPAKQARTIVYNPGNAQKHKLGRPSQSLTDFRKYIPDRCRVAHILEWSRYRIAMIKNSQQVTIDRITHSKRGALEERFPESWRRRRTRSHMKIFTKHTQIKYSSLTDWINKYIYTYNHSSSRCSSKYDTPEYKHKTGSQKSSAKPAILTTLE